MSEKKFGSSYFGSSFFCKHGHCQSASFMPKVRACRFYYIKLRGWALIIYTGRYAPKRRSAPLCWRFDHRSGYKSNLNRSFCNRWHRWSASLSPKVRAFTILKTPRPSFDNLHGSLRSQETLRWRFDHRSGYKSNLNLELIYRFDYY